MKCLRGRSDCKPIDQFVSTCGKTFTCCGFNDGSTREHEQDIFTHCWKTADTDDMSHMDTRDMAHTIAVLSAGLAEHESKKALEQGE